MNIEILHEYISEFKREIVDSGFKRDLDDYIGSLPASQNNIVALRDLAEKILTSVDNLYTGDLPGQLKILLPKEEMRPFTETPFGEKLRELVEDKEIQQPTFFSQLTQTLSQVQQLLQQNITEINTIEQFVSPYISEEITRITEEGSAIISIVFKEVQTISSLKQFTKTLVAWNRTLPVYHQLLKSTPPKDIEIVEVQNGSIDFVVNLNIDVALNMVDLFKVGFQVFASYLAYKKMMKPFIDSCHGNKALLKLEAEKEKLFLGNIGEAVEKEIKQQHKEAKKLDSDIDGTAIPKKVEQITNLITSHIVKGNDLKLLAMPEAEEGEEGTRIFSQEKQALQQQSMEARRQLKDIPQEDRIKLLEMYGEVDEKNDEDE